MPTISCVISQETRKNFKRLCYKQGMRIGSVVGKFIENYVQENQSLLEPEKPKEPPEVIIKIPEKPKEIRNEEKEISITTSNLISLENIKENENA